MLCQDFRKSVVWQFEILSSHQSFIHSLEVHAGWLAEIDPLPIRQETSSAAVLGNGRLNRHHRCSFTFEQSHCRISTLPLATVSCSDFHE